MKKNKTDISQSYEDRKGIVMTVRDYYHDNFFSRRLHNEFIKLSDFKIAFLAIN